MRETDRPRRPRQGRAPAEAGSARQHVDHALHSAATPLAPHVRASFEARLGAQLAGLRLHTGSPAATAARALGARAFTVGQDVVLPGFGTDPSTTSAGSRLLAHELAHVVQQRHAPVGGALPTAPEAPGSIAEREATAVAGGGDPRRLTSTGGRLLLHRQPLDPEHEGVVTTTGQHGTMLGGISASNWMQLHEATLAARLTEQLGQVAFVFAVDSVAWTATGRADFAAALSRDLFRLPGLEWQLQRVLGRAALVRAVDAGRDSYPQPFGPVDWQPGVVPELISRLTVRITESIARVTRRLAALELSRMAADRARQRVAAGGSGRPADAAPAAVASPGPTLLLTPPEPAQAVASFGHAIDPLVFAALVDRVAFDRSRLAALAGAERWDPELRLRRVRLEFQAAYGAPMWVRAIDPPDATLVEVANELFGDPTAADRLVDARPLYGFQAVDSDLGLGRARSGGPGGPLFRPEHQVAYLAALREMPAVPVVPSLALGAVGPPSPMQAILGSRLGDEVALRSARGIAPDPNVTPDAVRQRLVLINDRFAQIIAIGPVLAHAPGEPSQVLEISPTGAAWRPYLSPVEADWSRRLTAAAGRLRGRLEHLAAADDRETLLWETQTVGQLDVLNSAHAGLSFAAALAVDYRGQPRIHDAIMDVASRYVAAAEISDAYAPARAQLAAADRQSQLFPATVMELVLGDLRRAIDASRFSKYEAGASNETRYGLDDLTRTEQELRERLARVRALLLSAPDEARAELRAINQQLVDLQAGVGLAGNLDAIDAVLRALIDSLSVTGELRALFGHYGNDKVEDGIDGALKLHREWHDIYLTWKQDPATGRRLLREKAQSKEWRTWFDDMRILITDQAKADAWTTFGIMVGIAIVTLGVGIYVEAAAGAAWGAGAGYVAATATDTVLFTSMSYLLLEKDPSISGFFAQLGINLITFGGLRALSLGYRGLVGAEAAATAAGKLGEIATQFVALNAVALVQADRQSREVTGRGLSQDQIAAISLENLAFVGAMSLAAVLLKSPLITLSLSGELAGASFRVRRAAGAVERQLALAKTLETKATSGPARAAAEDRLVKAEDAYIAAERDLLAALGRSVRRADQLPDARRTKLLSTLGVTEALAGAVRSGEQAKALTTYIDALTAVRVQRALVPAGAGDFLVAPADFDMVVQYFRSQGATVGGSADPFPAPPPGGVSTGRRWASVRAAGAPEIRILETASTLDPQSVARTVEFLDSPFAQSARQTRMRAIARLLLENRGLISRETGRDRQAREASAALKEIRTPFHAKPGDPAPPLEGYVPDFVLAENIKALANLRAKMVAEAPDVIVGMERYGALMADILTSGRPELRSKVVKFTPVKWSEASVGKKGKFDPASMLAEFRRFLGPDTQAARTVAVVDSYMGGSTTESLRDQVYREIAREYPNVRFRNYVIRETFGFKVRQGEAQPVMAPLRGEPKAGQADLVRTHEEQVSLIVGDDVDIVFHIDSTEPIRVFDARGVVVETFVPKPGQTTRDVLIDIMNGRITLPPPRPVPDPVGKIRGRIPPDERDREVPAAPPVPQPVPEVR